jgi:SOS-response transcriptional repressor LexA
MRVGLTARERECLGAIRDSIRARGISPSYLELCGTLRLQSKAGIMRLVVALEERGMIQRLERRAHAIEVTDRGWAQDMICHCGRCSDCADRRYAQQLGLVRAFNAGPLAKIGACGLQPISPPPDTRKRTGVSLSGGHGSPSGSAEGSFSSEASP